MIKQSIDNNLYIMTQAVDAIEHHFNQPCSNFEVTEYGKSRVDYLKAGISRYRDSAGQDTSIVSSLLNLFSALYNERGDKTYDVIWTDIRDELSRIAYNN